MMRIPLREAFETLRDVLNVSDREHRCVEMNVRFDSPIRSKMR